jgi:hypothetical protein
MPKIRDRLKVLEQRKSSAMVPSGLGPIYDLMAAIDNVGGGSALLARVEAHAEDDADRAAIAAVPGGVAAIRKHVSSISHFYGGNP